MTRFIRAAALASLALLKAQSQDITGHWQGTLKAGSQELRLILHLSRDEKNIWAARLQSIDQGGFDNYIPVSAVTLQGSDLRLNIEAVRGTYEGKIDTAGDAISGIWSQGLPLPLEFRRATRETEWRDPSPHTQQFVTVDKSVKLEVLDWGGSGRSLILIPGLGNTAHVFDTFAPKLTKAFHVYGITRRGFGNSGVPITTDSGTYAADRLGDDVLTVVDTLKLNRPILVGHSLGGEELSSVGSRFPERVTGLIYLDAGYWYAYYDKARGSFLIDLVYLQRALEQLPGASPATQRKMVEELLSASLPVFEKDLQRFIKNLPGGTDGHQPAVATPAVSKAIMAGVRKYTEIPVPILAIFAMPNAERQDETETAAQANAFETGLPSSRVVRMPGANHFVFRSNEADVLREINAFVKILPH